MNVNDDYKHIDKKCESLTNNVIRRECLDHVAYSICQRTQLILCADYFKITKDIQLFYFI